MNDRADGLVGVPEMQLCFDGRNPRQLRIAALIHALDVWDQIELTDLSAKQVDISTHLQLITQKREVLTGYALLQKLSRTLPLLWPLALVTWAPGMAGKKTS
jgi:hypothetical protein